MKTRLEETNKMRKLMGLSLLNEEDNNNDVSENIVGHSINYGDVTLKIDGYRVNGDTLSIFFNPDTPETDDQMFKLAIKNDFNMGKRLLIVLNYNLRDGSISWDFSNLPSFTGREGGDEKLEKRMKSLLGSTLTELRLDDEYVDPKLRSFINSEINKKKN